MYWILYKIVGALLFSQPYLCIQPSLKFQPKILSLTSAIFHLLIPPLFVHKIILSSPGIPKIYIKIIFSLPQWFNQFKLSQRQQDWRCFSFSILSQSVSSYSWSHNHLFLIAQAQKTGVLQSEWKTIQSTFSHTLKLLSLIPYPTNPITRTHIRL